MSKKIFFSGTRNLKIIGIAQATEQIKNNAGFFTPQPIFDFLQEQQPDILFLNEGDYETTHITYAKHEFNNTKFILFKHSEDKIINNPFDLTLHLKNRKDKWFVPALVNENFTNGENEDQYSTDILVISDEVEVNDITNKWLLSLGQKYRLKIYGENKLNNPYYLGKLPHSDYKNAFASTKLVVMLNDEWLYTSLANNKIPVVFDKNETRDYEFSNYSKLNKLCQDGLESFDTTLQKIKSNFDLSDKTYLNFTQKILEEIYK